MLSGPGDLWSGLYSMAISFWSHAFGSLLAPVFVVNIFSQYCWITRLISSFEVRISSFSFMKFISVPMSFPKISRMYWLKLWSRICSLLRIRSLISSFLMTHIIFLRSLVKRFLILFNILKSSSILMLS